METTQRALIPALVIHHLRALLSKVYPQSPSPSSHAPSDTQTHRESLCQGTGESLSSLRIQNNPLACCIVISSRVGQKIPLLPAPKSAPPAPHPSVYGLCGKNAWENAQGAPPSSSPVPSPTNPATPLYQTTYRNSPHSSAHQSRTYSVPSVSPPHNQNISLPWCQDCCPLPKVYTTLILGARGGAKGVLRRIQRETTDLRRRGERTREDTEERKERRRYKEYTIYKERRARAQAKAAHLCAAIACVSVDCTGL